MNLLKRFLGYAPKVEASPGLLPPRTVQTLTAARHMRMTVAPKCPPGYSAQYLNGRFVGCSKLAGLGAPVGLGAAVDWTNQALIDAATALNDSLNANGCTQNSDPLVSAFQSAYIAAGGSIPLDSGGRSPIDGYYGNNTAAALRENFPNAVAGCVGAGYSGVPTGGTALGPVVGSSAIINPAAGTIFSSMFDGSSAFFGLASGWWVLGLVGLAVAAVVVNPKPGRAAPRRLSRKARSKRRGKRKAKRSKRGKRSARRGKKNRRSRRR